MQHVTLVPLDLRYANVIFKLSSDPHIKNALGIKVEKIEDTKAFLLFAIEEERQKRSLSRMIVNEENEIIGLTTLKHINYEKKQSHIGSWLGYPYWGKGYNEAAKKEIFKIAFLNLQLSYVFTGAKTNNVRSLKAQEKLPYISLHVEDRFPGEHSALENEVKSSCVLHVVSREKFLNWLDLQKEKEKYEGSKN
ncbi:MULTISPECIES: GNAT family N-acetyltransferase [Bacillus cereus group]|uniref:N-acetyltransferase domain-containing protein n=1 Tax=Bacillus thuringiensis TaxID=1428 RepID=A0A1C4FW36_BACTU|nr:MULTISPECIES: GNAT family N-acetyltransferase [Bacillus cereus group]MCC2325278.1 GNAT family N-acetyltransferase [Bacillus wiedmannii]MDP1457073.1 GNAT family N-acetyltransferase [Bacillus wiedmannii]MED2012124.1 GNAT family N-acetyltransferase [Bacillus wiedmannii]MED2881635.1 GNAT family N-acetyltransferase [Bacillus wiedmannii]MED3022272.1 GNAT family N-acetyltransferase [Bacillus wiedmannii]